MVCRTRTGDPNAPLNPQQPGLTRDDYRNGSVDPDSQQSLWQRTDAANRIGWLVEQRVPDPNDPNNPNPDPQATAFGTRPAEHRWRQRAFVYDQAGNLTFDGRLFYQYDAFNRLVRVHEASGLTPADFDYYGQLNRDPNHRPNVGQVLAHFNYDGLGRLIQSTRFDRQSRSAVWAYYYDGVRRIFELQASGVGMTLGAGATREYMWGPGYVDELIAEVETNWVSTGAAAISTSIKSTNTVSVKAIHNGRDSGKAFGTPARLDAMSALATPCPRQVGRAAGVVRSGPRPELLPPC